jgi:hypothetical protein
MATNIYVGLMVDSTHTNALDTATFDNVSIDGTNAVDYDDVLVVKAIVESANSTQTSVMPPVSTAPVNLDMQVGGGGIDFVWPADHIGWHLQELTNGLNSGNWQDVPNSTITNQITIPTGANGSVFFRLVYP